MTPHHLRHAWRSLTRAPGLAAVSILTITLGVGASTLLFSVVKAVLLNPLPYPAPEQLVWVSAVTAGAETRTSTPDFDDWQRQQHSLAAMALYSDAPLIAGGGETPQHVSGAIVSEQFFEVLGVQPALGRAFLPEEHGAKAMLASVILGHGLWQRAYGGDPNIIGRRVTLLGFPSTVIGVMPEGFAFPTGSDLWVSARALPDGNARTAHNFFVIGRLKPGVAADAAREDISAVARGLKQQYAGAYQTEDATAMPLSRHLVGSARTPLILLLGAVGLLLLIVCVNVANLLLVRAATRSRELALRTAMGASRRDLFRHLLAESVLLAGAGGAAGLLLAFWSMDLLRLVLPSTLPRAAEVRLDPGVLVFSIGISMAAGVLFGTLPSWRASRADINDVLKAGARGQTASRRSRRTEGLLIVSEVALSLVLVAGAGLLLDSFARLRAVDAGFSPAGVLSVSLSFPVGRGEVARLSARYRDLLDRVRAMPGVEQAGIIKDLPLDPIQRNGNFFIEQRPRDQAFETGYMVSTPGMMEALRIPILRGRGLAGTDVASSAGVVVINAQMARTFWPDRDPIGERMWVNSFEPKERWLTIVGIAGDVRQRGLTEPVPPIAYVNFEQAQLQAQLGSANLIVRSTGDSRALIPAIREALRAVQPEAAASFRPMDDVMAGATSRQRFQMQVLVAFAALALLLAAVGLYGVLAYAVASNRAAIGIRLALGAEPAAIFRMIASRGLRLTAAGALAGLFGCLALRSVLQSVLFGVSPSDPRVLSMAVAVLFATALAACWFPARRAMRVDPMTALREE